MNYWRMISAIGAGTAICVLICFKNNAWVIATMITLAYVAFGIGLLIKADRDERERKKMEDENRNKVFSEWLTFTGLKGENK